MDCVNVVVCYQMVFTVNVTFWFTFECEISAELQLFLPASTTGLNRNWDVNVL